MPMKMILSFTIQHLNPAWSRQCHQQASWKFPGCQLWETNQKVTRIHREKMEVSSVMTGYPQIIIHFERWDFPDTKNQPAFLGYLSLMETPNSSAFFRNLPSHGTSFDGNCQHVMTMKHPDQQKKGGKSNFLNQNKPDLVMCFNIFSWNTLHKSYQL